MITAISAAVGLIAIIRPRLGLILILLLLPFLPRYLGVGVGEGGFALTPRRILLLALFVGTALHIIWNWGRDVAWTQLYRENKLLIWFILLAFLTKFASTMVNSGFGFSLFYALDDSIVMLAPAFAAVVMIRTAKHEQRLIGVIVIALVITAILAVIEAAKGSVLLQGLVEVTVEEVGHSGLTDRSREDVYRAKALFDNPLLMAEYACIAWPWALYLARCSGDLIMRALGMLGVLLAPLAIYLAHTRSGWLVYLFAASAYGLLRFWQKSDRGMRIVFGCVLIVVAVMFVQLIAQVVANPLEYFVRGEAGSASAIERIGQWVAVAAAWTESPLFGFGMTRNFAEDFEFLNNLDSYWLRLVIEGGSILVILFVAICVTALYRIQRAARESWYKENRQFMAAAFISVLGLLTYKFFVSMPTNNPYLFVTIILVIRRQFWSSRWQYASAGRLAQRGYSPGLA